MRFGENVNRGGIQAGVEGGGERRKGECASAQGVRDKSTFELARLLERLGEDLGTK